MKRPEKHESPNPTKLDGFLHAESITTLRCVAEYLACGAPFGTSATALALWEKFNQRTTTN